MESKEAFVDYYLYVLGRKETSAKRHFGRLQTWESLTGKPASDIDSSDVIAYLRHNPLGHMGNTRKGMLTTIQCFHRFEAATGVKALNGICQIASPSVRDEESSQALEMRFVAPLIEACQRPLEFRLVYGGLYAGLRIGESGEIHGKRWIDGVLYVKGEKTDKLRALPVHPKLEAMKWELLAAPPTDPSTMQRVKRRLAKRTGIYFVSHQLRKRFTQSLADAGVDKGLRSDLLGHKTVTDLYAAPNLDWMRKALAKLPY